MEIKDLTAVELGEKIKKKEIGVWEAAGAYLEQMEKTEPAVAAYLEWNPERTKRRAEEVQRQIDEGSLTGPLAGVPLAVKDNICTRGIATTCASRMLEHFVPPYQAEAMNRMEQAGLVLLGKTNMDEFAMGSTTETSAFGVTRNPWDLTRAPGGSSGGSCAAVAAGEAALALGSDTGGSIRQPSGFCGVTGLKPTYGTVSRYGLVAYASSLDQIGPIGKDVRDCQAALSLLAAKDPKDATSLEREGEAFWGKEEGEPSSLRIGVPQEYLAKGVAPGVKEGLLSACRLMEEQGAQVEFFELGMTEYAIPAYYIIASAEASSNLERYDGVKYGYRAGEYEGLHDMYKQSRSQGFGAEAKRRIMLGSFVLSSGYYDAYYLKALKAKTLIRQAFDQAFAKYDVILAPAAPDTAPVLGESLKDPLQMYLGDIYTVAVNLAGLPALCLPCGRDEKGMPVGLQFIGDCFQEKKILRAAGWYERLRGPWELAFQNQEAGERLAGYQEAGKEEDR